VEIRDLTNQQVDIIIEELKNMLSHFDINTLNTPFGKIKSRNMLVSDINNINFKLSIHRGNREPERFSLDLRFNDTHDCLVRLDVKGGAHTNPDGTVAPNSHLHIYNNIYNPKDSFAHPIDLKYFPNISNLYYAADSFLDYTNVKRI